MRTVDMPFPKSLPDFMRLFPDDAACAAYLEDLRWPKGFACSHCGNVGEPYRFAAFPGRLRCRRCKKATYLYAGTVMERSHTPLSTWFWGAYLVSSLTPGMSAVQFQRQLGLTRYETAFQILHKLRAGMVNAERTPIGDRCQHVEVDETWIGGRERGKGRGAHGGKTLVIGAIEARRRAPKGDKLDSRHNKATPKRGGLYAGRLRLSVIPARTAKHLTAFVAANVDPKATVVTDGWVGYSSLIDKFDHIAAVENNDPQVAEEYLPLIHLIFSNLKAWLNGVHHGVGAQHLQAYLNEFTFRFNRRFWPMNTFKSLLGIGAENESPTYAELYSGDWQHPNQVDAPLIDPASVIK